MNISCISSREVVKCIISFVVLPLMKYIFLTSLGEIYGKLIPKNVNILYIMLGWEIFNCQLSFNRYDWEMA